MAHLPDDGDRLDPALRALRSARSPLDRVAIAQADVEDRRQRREVHDRIQRRRAERTGPSDADEWWAMMRDRAEQRRKAELRAADRASVRQIAEAVIGCLALAVILIASLVLPYGLSP